MVNEILRIVSYLNEYLLSLIYTLYFIRIQAEVNAHVIHIDIVFSSKINIFQNLFYLFISLLSEV